MAKIQRISSERDKLIEKLIDEKNSLYMRNKKLKATGRKVFSNIEQVRDHLT